MNQALSAGVVVAVLSALWLLGRPRPRRLLSTDTSAVAALNRAQVALVLPGEAEPSIPATAALPDPLWAPPTSPQDRLRLQRQLNSWWQSGPSGRKRAIEACDAWGHPSVLPWLRRGLRDADASVVALAAEAIAPYRGRLRGPAAPPQRARLPRNVARTL